MNDNQFVIKIPKTEYWDEDTNTFHNLEAKTIILEHSLYTIARWEKIWHKCFLKNIDRLSQKEMISYLKCMIIEPEVPTEDEVMYLLNNKTEYSLIQRYMKDKMSATYIREPKNTKQITEAQTAELIYYYLIKLRMQVDIFEHWHINRLMILISVFDMKDDTKHKRKITEADLIERDRINEERKKKLGTKG